MYYYVYRELKPGESYQLARVVYKADAEAILDRYDHGYITHDNKVIFAKSKTVKMNLKVKKEQNV